MTGHILPLAGIKAETGVPLLVDGAQSVGAILVEWATPTSTPCRGRSGCAAGRHRRAVRP